MSEADKKKAAEIKTALVKDAELLRDFTERLISYLESGGILSAFVISTLTEAAGRIAYNGGRYNQRELDGEDGGK